MPFREVPMVETREIVRLWLAGLPKKRIAARLGVDPKTVRHYVGAAERAGLRAGQGEAALTEDVLCTVLAALHSHARRERGPSWDVCTEHREFIRKHLDGGVRLTKVRRLLRRQGVLVSYATLHRFAVQELGFGRKAATVPVADCEPGEELQVDTGWMGYLQPDAAGKRRRYRAWIFAAVRSRHRFVYPCFQETTATAIEACEAAWDFFGGVFRVLVPDNTKAIVVEADPLHPRLNRAFLEYAQSRGFHIDPTRVRSPQDKGRVERSVVSVREDCFAGERIRTLEEARRHARIWCLAEYGLRRHTRTQRLPLEHFEAEEKPCLRPAPTAPYDPPLWCEPKVGRDQLAQVAKALYSLPTEYVGRKLDARADRQLVRFYLDWQLIKTHPRQPPGGRSIDPADFPAEKTAYAMRDVDFLYEQAARHGESVGLFAQALLAGPLPWTRMRRVYKLLDLGTRYGSVRLEHACARALDADMSNVYRLQRMLELAHPEIATARRGDKVIPLARYLRPASQYALPLVARPSKPEGEDRDPRHDQP
jgi:transposase